MRSNPSREDADRVQAHVEAFNTAVREGTWAHFALRFTPDAVMRFPQLPAPDAVGRTAIAAAYARQPPTDTMAAAAVRSAGDRDEVDFTWSAGGSGTMTIAWAQDLVQSLDVVFAEAPGT